MNVLVAFASKYGSTGEIAAFVAERLRAEGLQATALPVDVVPDAEAYDAFVVGSGMYIGHWLKPAVQFVRDHREVLSSRPTWLFSSGPLGPASTEVQEQTGAGGIDPEELAEIREAIQPRDHHVFDGALHPKRLSLAHRLVRLMPAGKGLLPEGDFRQWPEIEAWAADIARDLRGTGGIQ